MSATVTLPRHRRTRSDCAELSSRVRAAGLLDRRRGYQIAMSSPTLVALGAGWATSALLGATWWQLFTTAVLGVRSTQVAFLGHGAGHTKAARTSPRRLPGGREPLELPTPPRVWITDAMRDSHR